MRKCIVLKRSDILKDKFKLVYIIKAAGASGL